MNRRFPPRRRTMQIERLEERQLLSVAGLQDQPEAEVPPPRITPDQVLVHFRPGVTEDRKGKARGLVGALHARAVLTDAMRTAGDSGFEVITLPPGRDVTATIRALAAHPDVEFAEPNWFVTTQSTSADPSYTNGSLWGMYGDDSTITPSTSTNAFGSQAEEAWAAGNIGSTVGRTIYVGVIDEGIDYRHPDLYLNIAINQWEIPSAIRTALVDVDGDSSLITFRDLNDSRNQGPGKIMDLDGDGRITGADLLAPSNTSGTGGWADGENQDGNSYGSRDLTDDLIGWDFAGDNKYVYDGTLTDSTTDQHGTHVAGTIGALSNNQGVVGVAWNVQIISTKFLGPGGGYISDAIEALDYLTALKNSGVNIIATNNSWGGGGYSAEFERALNRSAFAGSGQPGTALTANPGMLFIAAAGNNGRNNDVWGNFPSNYTTTRAAYGGVSGDDRVIAVAAIDSKGSKPSWSNYGKTTVDLGAPGVGILSTTPNGGYSSFSGTSMATPHVTGAAVLYAAKNPGSSAAATRTAILNAANATPTSSMNRKTVTGGRLNIGAMPGMRTAASGPVAASTPSGGSGSGSPQPLGMVADAALESLVPSGSEDPFDLFDMQRRRRRVFS